jgi:NAD(P)-dependent dehydrogenase (short-subunit alcohol dehydrogenase family)
MDGATVLITGGNAGLGLATARGLARRGARVVITARDPAKGAAAADDVRAAAPGATVEVLDLDLASFASIRRCAAEALERIERLDVLVNNAGLVLTEFRLTENGFEMTFGVNHLGHFLLTSLLADRLRASAPARVVVVTSTGHRYTAGGLDFDDLQSERGYQPFIAYGRSKLANIYFTRELARRMAGTGVTANSVHPGFVGTRFGKDGDGGKAGAVLMSLTRPFALSPARGARTSIYLASSPDVADTTGEYFTRCRAVKPSRLATDDAAARRLWEVSEALIASPPDPG